LIKKISDAINEYKFNSEHKLTPTKTIEKHANSAISIIG
jgi:hypothetical protein